MIADDMNLARRVSELASRFPEVWQDYQGWLRDIVGSRSVLSVRYPNWQAAIIFRWRLFYFVSYVAVVVFFKRCRKTLESLAAIDYRYILQRTATLLAVAALTLCGTAATTGILIAFYYQPAAMQAHESLSAIAHDISSGAVILSLHHVAGNGLIVVSLVQLVVMFLGREFLCSWFTGWISGICLTLAAMGLSWTAIVLSWDQTSFWRFKIELSIVGSIPFVGGALREVLSGGSGINSVTLQHMYALHSYVLAIAAIFLSVLHLGALILQEQHWKAEQQRFDLSKLGERFLRKSL
ncbi:cytochrome b(N-terminal domain)/b6/petB subfamily, putative [Synechococcus sp. PCC 7335]|uniref:cytochrome b N-terminal domain-containing protein n=1 Tax=Synechococcus sp. (strain ATCC 29403 / PCC 7335) TaxID=91464 RepID=UPI00017EBF91|nr:cytochrome b N-terminal domain-containing protein [Synechococcus sp. PCC 7335]EDX85067.1 cytochrome b(N-terminal domain)/b6/petB subfamily, putative [Synechococcus sp. PCC 7335]